MDVEWGNVRKKVKLPDFLIVGAAKAGTTSLHFYLQQHPRIFMPKIKETWFFSVSEETKEILRGNPKIIDTFEGYLKLFKKASDNEIIGEASPVYLYLYSPTINKIKEIYGSKAKKLKIIIILRNPIERAWSQYMMHVRDGLENLPPMEAFKLEVIKERLKDKNYTIGHDYIGFGMYSKQIRAYLENFQTLILFYDELIENTNLVLHKIFTFLQVEPINLNAKEKYNVSGVPKNKMAKFIYHQSTLRNLLKNCIPFFLRQRLKYYLGFWLLKKEEMPSDIKKYLFKFYKEELKELKKILNEYKISTSHVERWFNV